MGRQFQLRIGQAVVVGAVLAALLAAGPAPARAASIVVNSTADGVPANDGACTLREAILNANGDSQAGSTDCAAGSGADTITFDPALSGTITLVPGAFPLGQLLVTSSMTISGPGANVLAVSGAGASRVFGLINGNYTVNIFGLTIRDGQTSGLGGAGAGVTAGVGTTVAIDQVHFDNNTASVWGGALASGGQLTVTNSTFTGNNAPTSGGYGAGGTYINSFGALTVSGSLFTGNTAEWGAAIYNFGSSATATGNCFENNNTTGGAGHFDVEQGGGTLTANGNWWGVASGPNTGGETYGITNGAALTDAAPLASRPVCGVTFFGGGGTTDLCADGRINCRGGDDYATVYPAQDDFGNGALHIYCIDDSGHGTLALIITPADLAGYPAMPSTNTLVASADPGVCRVPVEFYILSTGEYQVNIGPDYKGDLVRIIFTGLPPTGTYILKCNVLTSPDLCAGQ